MFNFSVTIYLLKVMIRAARLMNEAKIAAYGTT